MGSAKRSSIHQLTAAAEGFFAGSVPVDEAQALIAQWIKPVAAIEKAALRECLGRVLGESVRSTVNVPPHDNSAMDGWAVRYPDLNPEGSTQLKIESGASWAGRPWKGASVKPGHAVRVFTGALIPVGSDTVVAQEQTQIDPSTDQLTILPGQRAGQHRRLSGDDLAVGQIALAAGTLIGPAELGLAASLGLNATKGVSTRDILKPLVRAHRVLGNDAPWSRPMRSSFCLQIGETLPRGESVEALLFEGLFWRYEAKGGKPDCGRSLRRPSPQPR